MFDAAVLRYNVEIEMRKERELVHRREAQEWEAAKPNKRAQLAQLSVFEKMATDLNRARSLRSFMDEIVGKGGAGGAGW